MADRGGDRLTSLRAAYTDFGHGKYAQVMERLESLPDGGGEFGRALMLAAGALLMEADDPGGAAERMEEAFALGVAAPDLLTEIAQFFKRNGRHALAFAALASRELVAPQRLEGFVDGLPVEERARYAPWVLNKSPWVGRQSYYSTIHYKAALRERFGPEATAVLLSEMAIDGGRLRPRWRPLMSLLEYARLQGRDFEVVVSARELPSSRVEVFRGDDLAFVPRSRTMFTATLEDVIVSAKSNFLLTADAVLLDFQEDELRRRAQDLGLDPRIAWNDDDSVIALEPTDRDTLRTIPEAVWLSGTHSRAFGHWVMEFLPKLFALMAIPGFEAVPILVDDGMPEQHIESIRTFAGDAQRLIVLDRTESVRVSRLWVASLLQYMPIGAQPRVGEPIFNGFGAEGFQRLMRPVQSILEVFDAGAPPTAERVFLARSPYQHRKMTNSGEVQALMQRRGFEPFDFSTIGFREQLHITRGAKHIVGPAGSALTTSVFGRDGLRVGVLAGQGHPDAHWLSLVSRALDHSVVVVFGEPGKKNELHPSKSDYAIDLDKLGDYLDEVEAGRDPT